MALKSAARRPANPGRAAPKAWVLTPDRFLRTEHLTQLRAALEEWQTSGTPKQVRDAMIIELLLGSGLRVSEACALTVGHVHFQDGSPAIFVRRGKGGRPRLVPISSRLASRLTKYLESKAGWGEPVDAGRPLFLGQHGVELTRFGLSKIWKVALAAAGLAGRWGIHATRHTYAVEAYRKTKDLRLTQTLLGHSSPVTTTAYAALLDEDARAGVEKIWG